MLWVFFFIGFGGLKGGVLEGGVGEGGGGGREVALRWILLPFSVFGSGNMVDGLGVYFMS